MHIKKIIKQDILKLADFASENFLDDTFYYELSSNRNIRKDKLSDIFKESIRICMELGIAYVAEESGEYIAFILAFNYNDLQTKYPLEFSHIFGDSSSKELNKKLTNELDIINNKYIGQSKDYMYLLSIAVDKKYRKKGIATTLIKKLQDTYPHYNIFADVSNSRSLSIYKDLNFDILDKESGCVFVRYLSQQDCIELNMNNLKLAVPLNLNTETVFGKSMDGKIIEINNVNVTNDDFPFFSESINSKAKAKLLNITYEELLLYQRYINVLYYTEVKLKPHDSDDYFLIYFSNNTEYKGLNIDEDTKQIITSKENEWDFISDCYISIPIRYDELHLLKDNYITDNYLINRILASLKFRTNFESGIPITTLNNTGFKDRIERYYLGNIRIQIYKENSVPFNGEKCESIKICEPVDVALIVSIDSKANGGVLHVVSLSCGLLISQYLDSVVRNQVSVLTNDGVENLYTYLANNFKIYKKGTAKSFITVPKNRNEILDDFLASLLFCETYYNDGEVLGKVVDKEIKEILADDHGLAQYDYASVYLYSNILLQASSSLKDTLSDRIVTESITLFYIELLLFEESAINIANDEIIKFLTNLDDYSPGTVLDNINIIISDHVKTIDFWDIQMNYPSSKKSLDNIRKSFQIEGLRDIFKRNLDQLLMIYDMRSDIIDKRESAILTAIGAIFTTISILELVVDKDKQLSLVIGTLVVGLLIISKNVIFKKAFKRKKK